MTAAQSTTLLWVHMLNAVVLRLARSVGDVLRISPLTTTLVASLLNLGVCHGFEAVPVLLLVLLHFVACQWLLHATRRHPHRYAPSVWALSVCGIVLVNAVEAFRLPRFLSRPLRQLPRWGLLGASSFTAVHTFRYTALRMLSYGLDIARPSTAAGVGSVHPQLATTNTRAAPLGFTLLALKRYLAYCMYSPLRVSGPIITFDTFCTFEVASAARPPAASGTCKVRTATAWADIRMVFAWLLATDVAMHTFYFPSILFFARTGGARLLQRSLQPWEWCVLLPAILWCNPTISPRFFGLRQPSHTAVSFGRAAPEANPHPKPLSHSPQVDVHDDLPDDSVRAVARRVQAAKSARRAGRGGGA
jgi:hypothetical protein